MSFHPSNLAQSRLYPALVIEHWISAHRLRAIFHVLKAFFLLFIILILLGAIGITVPQFAAFSRSAELYKYQIFGLVIILLAFLLVGLIVRIYLRSWYYFEYVVGNNYRPGDRYTFTVGRILYGARDGDVIKAFLLSDFGRELTVRAGIAASDRDEYLRGKREPLPALVFSPKEILKVRPLTQFLFDNAPSLRQFFATAGLTVPEVLVVVDWLVRRIEREELANRWWRSENLDRIPSLGRGWAYGETPELDHYSEDLLEAAESQISFTSPLVRTKEVRQIETILARGKETNCLIVGADAPSRLEVIWALGRAIQAGVAHQATHHQRLLLFRTAVFASEFKDRNAFERKLLAIFSEAVAAGDVILVIENLPEFLHAAEALGSHPLNLLDAFFASSRLSVIALADTDQFHRELEGSAAFTTRFEKVLVEDLPPDDLMATLCELADSKEKETGVLFTYPALRAIVTSAGYFAAAGTTSTRTFDLVEELTPWSLSQDQAILTEAAVFHYVREKTNLPVDALSGAEQAVLLHLEDELAGRVVGQTEALKAVASALRRARAGTNNPKRPLGSFLFLGPTGVGKTETAKALSALYFGNEDRLLRLDMSEYQGPDALRKLTGSADGHQPGILSTMIRERVFGVVLLDEFEKTTTEVKNLFLQILDEGMFADVEGKKVNARSIIFIATSNAGAEAMWAMTAKGEDPTTKKDQLVSTIVAAGNFSPELINRFDAVIIFHPLQTAELEKIAVLLLGKLSARLAEKGITLSTTAELAAWIAKRGANEHFGARPMNRFIQDTIEESIAQKIVEGSLKRGATVTFALPATDGAAPMISIH